MKIKSIQQIGQTVAEAFQHCWHRFTVTVGFIVALTAYVIFLLTTDEKLDWNQNFICGYYLSVGTLLSLSLHLWGEETGNTIKRYGVQLLAHGLFITDAILLYNHLRTETAGIETAFAHAAAIFAIWLSIFHMSFLKEKNDVASWNFTIATASSYIWSLFIGLILCAGIHLLLLSLNQLFGIKIGSDVYSYVFALCCVFLNHMLFLGQLPAKKYKHDTTPYSTGFGNSILHYIFLPLTGGYLAVLYVYAAQVLVNWELPSGWVSWLVIVLMALCLLIEFGLYPARIRGNKSSDNAIARWLPAMILPILLLMTIGIVRRFCDYGITVYRLYLASLNAWFYIVCIGLILLRARRINWIPLSFAAIFILTSALPVNFCSITKSCLLSEIEGEMQNHDLSLPLTEKQHRDWLASLPNETAKRMNDKLEYLYDFFGAGSIAHLIDKDIAYRLHSIGMEEISASDIINVDIECWSKENMLLNIPKGCTQVIRIPTNGYGFQYEVLPRKFMHNGILPVEILPSQNTGDSVYFDIDALQKLADKYPTDSLPHTTFRCNSENTFFVLTGFHLRYNKEKATDTTDVTAYHNKAIDSDHSSSDDIILNFNGYMFRQVPPRQ